MGRWTTSSQALTDLCQEHFAFQTAVEDGGPPVADGAGSQVLASRVSSLEGQVAQIASGVQELLGAVKANGQGARQKPTTTATTRVRFSPEAHTIPSGSARPHQNPYPSLDPGVVAAALQAGVGEEALSEMQNLVGKAGKISKMREAPLRPSALHNPLSETEDDLADESGLAADPVAADPMTQAVTRLTEIVSVLAQSKKPASANRVEAALDGVHQTSEPGSYGSGKRAAAARRALRAALVEHPTDLSAVIERLMWEDLSSQTLTPGSLPASLSARAWIEHRSKIGSFRSVAHAAWGVSGALDALFRNDVPQARARLCLLLLQLDQCAVDRGGWQLAAELSLEAPPPFSVLAQHQPPNPADGDLPFSKLLDARWAEIALAHLRDTEDYMTKRKGLNKGQPQKEDSSPEAKRRPKARPKPKAGESTGSADN